MNTKEMNKLTNGQFILLLEKSTTLTIYKMLETAMHGKQTILHYFSFISIS